MEALRSREEAGMCQWESNNPQFVAQCVMLGRFGSEGQDQRSVAYIPRCARASPAGARMRLRPSVPLEI
jgi:hypothetical protein